MVALLGVLKSGAAYLPLDLDYPAERLAYMLADSGSTIVVTTERDAHRLPSVEGLDVVQVDAASPVTDPEGEPAPAVRPAQLPAPARPDDPAYLIYTSGSTGRPKGVVVTHRAIGNRLTWMQGAYELTPDDRVLQKTPSSFDVSVWEFFWALREGAAVVLAAPDGHRDPAYLARLIRSEGITTMHFVPSMLEAFLATDEVTADPAWAGSLRRVFSSGEALSGSAAHRWHELTGVPLHNLYGPTEAAVDVTYHAYDGEPGTTVPIGRPVWNTGLRVLDSCLRPVPDGVPGELYLTGVQLARGYHRRPALTADRFVADPYATEPGARMYRTGDLVRRRPDGTIDYLGRTDRQVKLRGNRVELGEIEAELTRLPRRCPGRRRHPRSATRRLRGPGIRRHARPRQPACRPRGGAARAPGPRGIRRPRRPPAHPERQARPGRAARTRGRTSRTPGARRAVGAAAHRDLRGRPRHRGRRPRRRLLPARRRQHQLDRCREPRPCGGPGAEPA